MAWGVQSEVRRASCRGFPLSNPGSPAMAGTLGTVAFHESGITFALWCQGTDCIGEAGHAL